MKEYISERELHEIIGVSLSTLRQNRHMRVGFPYYKIGKSVKYKMSEVLEYIDERKVKHGKTQRRVLGTQGD